MAKEKKPSKQERLAEQKALLATYKAMSADDKILDYEKNLEYYEEQLAAYKQSKWLGLGSFTTNNFIKGGSHVRTKADYEAIQILVDMYDKYTPKQIRANIDLAGPFIEKLRQKVFENLTPEGKAKTLAENEDVYKEYDTPDNKPDANKKTDNAKAKIPVENRIKARQEAMLRQLEEQEKKAAERAAGKTGRFAWTKGRAKNQPDTPADQRATTPPPVTSLAPEELSEEMSDEPVITETPEDELEEMVIPILEEPDEKIVAVPIVAAPVESKVEPEIEPEPKQPEPEPEPVLPPPARKIRQITDPAIWLAMQQQATEVVTAASPPPEVQKPAEEEAAPPPVEEAAQQQDYYTEPAAAPVEPYVEQVYYEEPAEIAATASAATPEDYTAAFGQSSQDIVSAGKQTKTGWQHASSPQPIRYIIKS